MLKKNISNFLFKERNRIFGYFGTCPFVGGIGKVLFHRHKNNKSN
jgi:hypothetical protein